MMVIGIDMVGKLRGFNDVDNDYSLAVNLGYFYGFLRIQLSSMVSIKISDEIIEKSLDNLNKATNGKISLDNFVYIVRTNYNNAFENIKRATNSSDIITHMAQLYLNDLYQREVDDNVKLTISTNNINLLYGMILKMAENIKII